MTPESTAQIFRFYDGTLLPDELFNIMTQDQGWFPKREVAAGATRRDFARHPGGLPPLQIVDRDMIFDLHDYLVTNSVWGLVVLKDGRLVVDYFRRGLSPDTPWFSASLAKSIAATLVGVALAEGTIRSLDDPLSRYVDVGGVYVGVTLRQLLRMSTGVRWNEDYGDSSSDRRRLLMAQMTGRPGAMLGVMEGLSAAARPDHVWSYNTGESCLLGAILEGATGMNLAEYLSAKLWSRIGMAHSAIWWQETGHGTTVSGTGLYASLGDYSRFGQFVLEECLGQTASILPKGWMCEATSCFYLEEDRIPYGYMWWVPDPVDTVLDGSFQAEGIYGQFIHINPAKRIVAVVASTRAKPSWRRRLEINDNAFFAALARALT